METTDRHVPQARNEGLVVHEVADEVLVYDLERHRAHALNRTAAWIWRHCDGKTSVADIARSLHHDLGILLDEAAVWLALERLGRARLLCDRPTAPGATALSSRRALVRRLTVAGGLALVTSIVAPEAHAAASRGNGSACTSNSQCISGLCCTNPRICVSQCNNGHGCPTGNCS